MQSRDGQITALLRAFPSTTKVKESSAELLLRVEHTAVAAPGLEYELILLVQVRADFPRSPPLVLLPFGSHVLAITPPNVDAEELPAYAWTPSSSLVDAVRHAMQHAVDQWGPVTPPTLSSVTVTLSAESDRLLSDLVNYQNCREAYMYQMPVVKSMRESVRHTLDEVEASANSNVELRPRVDQLQKQVDALQIRLQDQIDQLKQVGEDSLLRAVCTPEALLATLERDAHQLGDECRGLGKQALDAYSTDRKRFADLLRQFKAKSKERHVVDIKRRWYKASVVDVQEA